MELQKATYEVKLKQLETEGKAQIMKLREETVPLDQARARVTEAVETETKAVRSELMKR